MPPAPYLSASDLRDVKPLDNATTYPDAALEALVEEFEDLAERYLGTAYQVRTATAVLAGASSRYLFLPHVNVVAISAVTVDGTAFTSDERADVTVWADGRLERAAGWYGTQVTVTYTHGLSEPPAAVLRACKEFVRAKATAGKGNQSRAVAGPVDPQLGFPSIPTADWSAGRPTGLPQVDAALNSVADHRVPGIA